jgi:hypothetical protein
MQRSASQPAGDQEEPPQPTPKPGPPRGERGRFIARNRPPGSDMGPPRRPHKRRHPVVCQYVRNRPRAARLTPDGRLRPQPAYGTLDLSIALDVTPRTVRRWLARGLIPCVRTPNPTSPQHRVYVVTHGALLAFAQAHPHLGLLAKLEGADPPECRAHAEFLAFTAAHPRYQFLVRYLEDAPRPPR